jgi:hypothetical protein
MKDPGDAGGVTPPRRGRRRTYLDLDTLAVAMDPRQDETFAGIPGPPRLDCPAEAGPVQVVGMMR